jgi:PAT family beta-lactamase induction signal transducer AmpG
MTDLKSFVQVFQSRKMAALLAIGFASGLPFSLTRKTLQAWMTVEGVDLSAIGLISLVAIPYSLKFLWSPLLDCFVPPFLGRRRGWLFLLQGFLIAAIAMMALQKPSQSLQLLAFSALFVAFLSASQDIAADAYRTDVLETHEMGEGVAIFVLGYRIALLVTGSFALMLADRLSWPIVYSILAALMGIGMLASLWAPEPLVKEHPPESLFKAVYLPFVEFFQRLGWFRGVMILAFIMLYKLGDSFANLMSTPFFLKIGFSQTDIGAIDGGMGLIATIVGTLAGCAFLSRLGINRSLWIFGGFQAVSNFAYFALAQLGHNYTGLVVTINIEKFCGGMGDAAFIAFFMSLCNSRFSATQFALLSSLMAVSRDIVVAPSGAIAEATGWPLFFLISIAVAIPGLLLLPVFAPWNEGR